MGIGFLILFESLLLEATFLLLIGGVFGGGGGGGVYGLYAVARSAARALLGSLRPWSHFGSVFDFLIFNLTQPRVGVGDVHFS